MSRQATYPTTAHGSRARGPTDGRGAPGGRNGGASAALELDRVTKTYGRQPPVPALRSVSLTVARGELVAIVGPSGSGKTTLLHIVGTLERPSSGTVRLAGLDITQLDDRQLAALRARASGSSSSSSSSPSTRPRSRTSPTGCCTRAPARGSAAREPATPSRGSGSRTARAFAQPTCRVVSASGSRSPERLVGQPAIVLADEPTGNLDSTDLGGDLRAARKLNADGATIVVITHDHELAARLPARSRCSTGGS